MSIEGQINTLIGRFQVTNKIRYFWQQHFTVEIEWRIEKLYRPWKKKEVRLIQPRTWSNTGAWSDKVRSE